MMRYSLKTLFGLVTVVSLIIAAGLYITKDFRERMALRAELLATTGAQFVSVNADRRIGVLFTKNLVSSDLKKYKKIDSIELKGIAVTSDSMLNLAQLESVDVLLFQTCTIPDSRALEPLSTMGSLRALLFWNTVVDDAVLESIAAIPGLESVDFSNAQAPPAALERLRFARPEIKVTTRP